MRLEDELATWLLAQRWFAGKGRTLRDLAIVADTEVAAGDPALRHLIVLVSHGATADHYQIPIGLRSQLPDWLEHARIGTADDGRHVYDALHDPALTRHLIRAIAANQSIESLTFSREPGAEIETELDSIVLTAEQSNTSLVFGEQMHLVQPPRHGQVSITVLQNGTQILYRPSPNFAGSDSFSVRDDMFNITLPYDVIIVAG